MDEMDRAEFAKKIFTLLGERGFKQQLEVVDDDGHHPIVTALPGDLMEELLHAVGAAGGRANVAVSMLNGFSIISMDVREAAASELIGSQLLDPSIAVRAFLAVLVANEEGQSYRFSLADTLGVSKNEGTARLSQVGS